MRIIHLARVALLIGAAAGFAPASANMKHRFVVIEETSMSGDEYRQQLSLGIKVSVLATPSGAGLISTISCSRDSACATPADYLEMFLQNNEGAMLASGVPLTSVDQLAEYIDGLVVQDAPVGAAYWMACRYGKNPKTAVAKWDCLSDVFKPGEKVLVDPRTNRIVMRVKCSNPVGKPDAPEHCVYKHVFLKNDDEYHSGWLGPDAFPKGDCIPAIMKAGETEWTNMLLDECPRNVCDFSGPSRDLDNAKIWEYPRISFKAEISGEYIIRLPAEVTTVKSQSVDCVVRFAASRQTFGVVIDSSSYTDGHAYLVYQNDSPVPATWHGSNNIWKFTDGKFK